MDFGFTPTQQQLRADLIRFAERELGEQATGSFGDAWQRCARWGVQGLPVPSELGGGDADPLTVAIAMEALGYGCRDNGLLFSMNAQMWSVQMPILAFGSAEQKKSYLSGMCDGSLIGAHAMTEPAAGSDAFSLRTTAVRNGADYILDGQKSFVTNAPIADVFLIFAATDPGAGFAGISAFLLDADTEGVQVGRESKKMGLAGSPMGDVFLQGCRVPDAAILGDLGAGIAIFNSSMEWERAFIAASVVGTMQRQIERCVTYANDRRQFGRPIKDFQAVSHRIANMKLRLETCRLLLYRTAWLKASGQSADLDASMTKLHISESFVQSSLDAIQIHGAYGYMKDNGVERDLRDAVAGRIYSGTSEIQREIIAKRLGL